jgi:hypothetical protein
MAPKAKSSTQTKVTKAKTTTVVKTKAPSSSSSSQSGGRSLGEKAIIGLTKLRMLNMEEAPIKRVMDLCDTTNEKSFYVLLQREQKKGLLELMPGKMLRLTKAGMAAADAMVKVEKPTSNAEMLRFVQSMYKISGSGVPGKAFACLAEHGPRTFEQLVDYCEYKGKNMASFKTMLGKLTGPGVVVKEGTIYRLADFCFIDN